MTNNAARSGGGRYLTASGVPAARCRPTKVATAMATATATPRNGIGNVNGNANARGIGNGSRNAGIAGAGVGGEANLGPLEARAESADASARNKAEANGIKQRNRQANRKVRKNGGRIGGSDNA